VVTSTFLVVPRSNIRLTTSKISEAPQRRFRAYPTNRVIAILISRTVADAAVSDLVAAGIPASAIETTYGTESIGQSDISGGRSGLIGKSIRGVLGLVKLTEYKQRFEQALRAGECLLAVDVAGVLTRRTVYERLKAREAHYINFFAPSKVVRFAP
jgi:hypothetical protein